MKHGYSVLSFPQKHNEGMSAREYRSAAKGESKKLQLMNVINDCMCCAGSREQFIAQMESRGYKVRWEQNRKNITYTTPDGWQCRDRKLFGEKYLKEMMELEFAARAEIVYGRADGTQSSGICNAEYRTDSGTVYHSAMSHSGRVGETDTAVGTTGEQVRMAGEVSEGIVRSPVFLSDPNANGRAAEIDKASGSNGRTGWEEEREAFLSSQIQTAQTVSAGMGVAHGADRSVDAGSVVASVVQLGRRMEQVQSNAPVIDSTTRRFRSDSKQLRKEQEKKIALGHKEDDHEDDTNYSMRQSM